MAGHVRLENKQLVTHAKLWLGAYFYDVPQSQLLGLLTGCMMLMRLHGDAGE
jgi:hypothetical protein